jgi:polysaccharide biosynthesis/export protein
MTLKIDRSWWAIFFLAVSVPLFGQHPETSSKRSTAVESAANKSVVPESVSSSRKPDLPDEYVVGDSDVLRITVWKEPDLSQTVVVRPDGNITLPLIKDINVAGLTPDQLELLLTDKLKVYLNNPQVAVTIQEIRSRRTFITGEVLRPGTYPLLAPTTVLQLIAQAGGFTPFAKRGKIFVMRQQQDGRQIKFAFDYSKVTNGEHPEQNIVLRSGDTVVVP